MLPLKLFGAGLVVFACAMLGRQMTQRLKNQVRTLDNLHHFLKTLSDQISFSLEPLPEIMKNVSAEDLGYVSDFARTLADELARQESETFRDTWKRTLSRYRKQLGISDTTIHILETLGQKIGTMSKEIEIGNLRLALDGIEQESAKTRAVYEKNCKVYRNLSLLAGLLLVIILF